MIKDGFQWIDMGNVLIEQWYYVILNASKLFRKVDLNDNDNKKIGISKNPSKFIGTHFRKILTRYLKLHFLRL